TGKRKATLTADQINSGLLDPGRFVNEPIHFDPGLTGKYTITPNVTLDFAINPDFAQIESDQLVVRAISAFRYSFQRSGLSSSKALISSTLKSLQYIRAPLSILTSR